jgi:hypothetical protein
MRAFTPADVSILNEWLAARGAPQTSVRELGSIGFIVDGVAAGFLLQTEAVGVAMLDGFATNPHARGVVRYEAMTEIAERLCGVARMRGVTKLGWFTSSKTLIEIGGRMGFVPVDAGQADATRLYRKAVE